MTGLHEDSQDGQEAWQADDQFYQVYSQGWQGLKALVTQEASGERGERPDLDTLIDWLLEENGCEAIDGCWVEPDGICPHGYPSWFLELGLS